MSQNIDLRGLVRLSFAEPEAGFRAVQALNLPVATRWTLVAAAVLAGVVLAYLLPVMAGQTDEIPSPLTATLIQAAMNLIAISLLTVVGRMFGGIGRFEDAILLVGWLQMLMVGMQAIQVVVMLLLPPLGALVLVLAIAAFFWLFSGFTCALHGFQSRLLVLVGGFGTLFALAFVLSFVMIILGIQLPGMGDV
ncbi:MAG: YIP1 family protein [Pararhodobacter sp.]|nr:YIP1 family protein [Pararhodobacter sp.]